MQFMCVTNGNLVVSEMVSFSRGKSRLGKLMFKYLTFKNKKYQNQDRYEYL